MAGLFNSMDTESPQFGADVSSGGDMYPSAPPEVRIERPQPVQPADIQKPRSIMDRMRELANSLVTPMEEGNYTTSPLYGIGRTIQAVGEGIQGRGGQFLQREGALQESIRRGGDERIKLGLEAMRQKREDAKAQREANREDLKTKAYEQLSDFDFSTDEMKNGKKLGSVVSTLLQAGDHTTAVGLIKMVQEAGKSEKMRDQLNTITNRLKLATTKEQADEVLLDMPAELAKEHHSRLSGVVKSWFGSGDEKVPNDNELVQFVETKGRIRGATIPKDLTTTEADAMIKSKRSMQQQQINVTTAQNTQRNAEAIRDDLTKQTQRYRDTRVEYEKLEENAKKGTAVSDKALIYQTMKVMDPPSTVREAEAAMIEAARANPLFTGLKFYVDKLAKGTSLTVEQRKDLLELARSNYRAERGRYTEQRKYYGDVAEGSKLSRDVIGPELPQLGGTAKVEKPAAKAGNSTPGKPSNEERLNKIFGNK